MSEHFERFFNYIVNPEKPTLVGLRNLNPHCTLTTREGQRYNVTLRGNRFRVVFAEGWLNFVRGEEIKTDNCLWFDRTSFTDFIVTIHTDNQVEQDLRHRYTLEIKKTHPIPINFLRSYVLSEPSDTFRAVLEFEGTTYELQIVEGHGKVLMQNWDAEELVEATEMVEGSTWCFTLIPYICVRFEVGQKGVEEGESEKEVFWREQKYNTREVLFGITRVIAFFRQRKVLKHIVIRNPMHKIAVIRRGSNYSSTLHAPTDNDTPSVFEIATPDIIREHFRYIREGFSNKWLPAAEESFCSILLHYIQSEGFNSEFDIYMVFDRIYRSCLDCPLGVFDIHAKTVYLHEDDREEALEFWALVDHYCSNNPEPLWETLKIVFEPLGLDPYPGEMRARDERNHRKLAQVVRDYWAEERRMAAQRRRREN
ncbi:AP2/B3-like transcriptional factor family protein [Striga asiatica]|uniref:AP2/B3-like transcriptional factor family protein n=1 Tax=Striga asiatica TaxID=4170 RepID=A0A5A7NYI8_STRAF|nr:AP2/B3-like transcriptional factor family protein [Striga asiatica]